MFITFCWKRLAYDYGSITNFLERTEVRCSTESNGHTVFEIVEVNIGSWQTNRSDCVGERDGPIEPQESNVVDYQSRIVRRMSEDAVNRRHCNIWIDGTAE